MTAFEWLIAPMGVGIILLLLQASFARSPLGSLMVTLAALLASFSQSQNGFEQLALIAATAVIIIGQNTQRQLLEEYKVLLLLSCMGALTCVQANDFMTLFVGIELMTLPIYGLIAWAHTDTRNLKAAIKYIILAGTSSAFMLLGMAFIYAETGSMALTLGSTKGSLLLFVGLGFKLSLAPFHLWTGDIYADSPLPITAFLATVAKIAIAAVLVKLVPSTQTAKALSVMAILSMLVGSLLTLRQQDISRFLGYSSIAHMGYVLTAWLVGGNLLLYMSAYTLSVLVAFWALAHGTRNKASVFALSISFFSLMGLPILPIFWGKYQILVSAFSHQHWTLFALFILSSLIGVYGYTRIVAKFSLSLILVILVGCSSSKTKEPEPAPKVLITRFDQLSLAGLTAAQQSSFIKLVNAEICPCNNCPQSFAACLSTCKPATILGQWVIDRLKEGVPMEVMEQAISQEVNSGFGANPQIIDLDGYASKGDPKAPITIVEFADFECSHCKVTAQSIEEFLNKHPKEVRLVYKHFPLEGHKMAKQASLAAEAAGLQGKFWPMHKALFASKQTLTESQIASLAKQMGLNMAKFQKDLANETITRKVENSLSEGQLIGIQGTPALYFNGRPFHLSTDLKGLELRLNMENARNVSQIR